MIAIVSRAITYIMKIIKPITDVKKIKKGIGVIYDKSI